MKGSLIPNIKGPKRKERDLTPLNNLCLTQDNEDSSCVSFSHVLNSDSSMKKKVISHSLGKKDNALLANNKINKLLGHNNYYLPKKTQNNCLRNYSGSIRKKFISSSRNKSKKKLQKKKVALTKHPRHSNYLLTVNNHSLHTNKSNETINTNQSVNLTSKIQMSTNGNNPNSYTTNNNNDYSFGLSKTEKEKLKEIKQSIIALLLMGNNRNLIINELLLFLKNIDSFNTNGDSEVNTSHSHRGKEKKSRCKSQLYRRGDKNSYSITKTNNNSNNDQLLTKINTIDKKFELMRLENTKLKHLITEKTGSFDEVKNSIKTFKEEIDRIKKKTIQNGKNSNSNSGCNKSQSQGKHCNQNNPNLQNTQIKLVNKAKLPMKNVSINLQLIQKVTGVDGFKGNWISEKEKTRNRDRDKNKEYGADDNENKEQDKDNQTIINLQHSPDIIQDKMSVLNFDKIPKKVFDFNEEFLKNVDDFSPSWRRDVDKMLQRKNQY